MRTSTIVSTLLAVLVLNALALVATAQSKAAPADAPPSEPGLIPPPTAAPPTAAPPAGMTPLFDGKTTSGWLQAPPDTWVAKNGVLASVGAGRGVIYTNGQYDRFRLVFDVRHVYGKPDHRAAVLIFCAAPREGEKPADALEGIQFQVPNGGSWDYRKGKNNNGKGLFTRVTNPKFDEHQWSRVELLVDAATGTARMAVAQPPGAKAVEVLTFKDPAAGRKGPIAFQMHNRGLYDEFANVAIEVNPVHFKLMTAGE
jgi:hypothetical protein